MTATQFTWTASDVNHNDKIRYQGRVWQVGATPLHLARIGKVNLCLIGETQSCVVLLDATHPIEIIEIATEEEAS